MKKLYFLLLALLTASGAFAQTSTAWNHADSAQSITKPGSGIGNPVWNTGTMPYLHNGVSYVAAATLTGGGNNLMMDHAYYYSFNFSIPDTMDITGVEVIMSRFGCNSGSHSEDTISLAYNGLAIGDYVSDTMSSSGSTDTFGSSMDTWGNNLTPAIINDNSFGVYFDTRSVGVCTFDLQDCRIKVHYQSPTGIIGIAESNTVKLYPNPATTIINVQTTAAEGYIITDCLGRIMRTGKHSATETKVDIANLAPGLYYIRSGNEVSKFIKQ